MFKHTSRKRITIALAVVCCLSLLIGSLALFTADANLDGSAQVGTLTIGVTGDIEANLLLGGDENIANSETIDNWNPGDTAEFGYTVSATGTKAVRYQETIVLTVSGVDVSEGAVTAGTARLTITGAGDPVFAATADGYTLTYTITPGTLDGTQEDIDGNGLVSSADKTYTLAFAEAATNEYQGASIEIAVNVEAVQFAYTDNSDIPAA